MDSKVKDGHRLIISKDMEMVPKSKGKEKARKELWDSLCAVYENEADRENGEVDVCELEEWTVTNPDSSMRALTHLATTNPQILTAAVSAFPDHADLILELELEDKEEVYGRQVGERKNKQIGSEISKKCRCKSSFYMKSTKKCSPVKKCKKPRTVSQKEKLSVSLMRRKTEEKSKCLMKLQKILLNEKDSDKCVGKRKRKQNLSHSEESKESINNSKVHKRGMKHQKVQLESEEECYPNHKCKLEYRNYLKTKNVSTRPDNRVFTCKLIFKDGNKAKARLQQIKDRDEHVSNYCADLPRHTKYDLKVNKKAKSRLLKNTSPNENVSIKCNTANGEDKGRHKFKELERHNKVNTAVPEELLKEKEKNVPSVIVLHRYKKGLFNSQTEPCAEEVNSSGKATQRPEKNGKKAKVEQKSNSRKNILSDDKSSCNELKKRSSKIEVECKHSLDYKQQLKDKIKKKRDKGVVYKTLSTNLESKLRKKRKKLERQQLLKEVASTLNADTDIYDKIKTLPIKIDENQLIFMHPSHIAKALEHFKTNKNNQERVKNDSTCNELNENKSNTINKEEETEASLTKLALDNNTSSKKLRVLSSIKKMRKPIPIVLEEKSDISFIKVSKHKKEHNKKRCKLTSTEKNKSIIEEPDPEVESRGSGKVKSGSNLMSSENYSKAHCSVIRQNVCFGDNSIDVSNVQNNKLPTTLSGSIRSKSKFNKVGSNLKNGSAKELKVRRINKKEMEKLKNLIKSNDGNENQIKPSASEDENKLTFQLLKSNMNPKNPERLRKNVYSVSDRMGSKENIPPAIQNDRLYVTKRMLFYTNKESSSTSKESLNIAIRRDTEISNNGSSNNVLNVVIKQKKNSSTSTKSINSPKLGIENQCSKNCDTKSLEKMFVENYLEKIYKNNDINKYKHLKEAECQTEENAFSSDNKEGGRNEVSTQSFEPSNNTIQDEFRNFLTFHFKNINFNPAVWKNSAIGKNIDEEMLNKKQTFQPGSERINVQCKFGDHYPNYLKQNDKLLTPENQYSNTKLSGYVHNFNSICSPQNNCNSELKPFIRVLNNDEYNLQKTKCDNDSGVSKVNASDECKNKQTGSDEGKGITKLNLRIPENQCQKTESENIAEKLKNIGLSDKTSFVKVISSNNKLDTSFNTKVDSQDILKFKLMRSPRIKKDILSKPIKVNMKEDSKNVIYRRQKSKFFLPKNITSLTGGVESDNLPNTFCAQKIKTVDSKSTKETGLLGKDNNHITDTYNLKTNNFSDVEKNKFQTTVGDNLKSVKHNFINVLSANDDTGKKDITPKTGEMANRVELTKKASHSILRNLILSEVGVQTDTSDLLPSVPYKNVSGLKRAENPNVDSKYEQNITEAELFQEKPDLSNRNDISKLIHIDSVGILPQEKGSFVHIINKYDTDMYLNTNNLLLEKNTQVSYPVNFSENENKKQIRVLKGFDEEKQIVDKINAVYEFLQYLDKMLKDNSFLKLDANKRNTNTIGHFNSTLKCLCNNCIEILNKIEVNGIENLKDRKPLEQFISQPVSEAFFFGQAISEVKNEPFPNVNGSSNGQYVSSNELQNNSTTIFNDLKSNNGQMNPFCVIVTPEEKSRQQSCNDFFKKIGSNQSKKGSENKTSFEFKERSYEDFLKQKFSEMADKTSMNKKVTCAQISKSEINNNKITNDSNKRFYKQVNKKYITSNDNSSKCLALKPSLKKSYEPESRLNFVGYNDNSKYHPHHTINPQFNCINNNFSKIKLDSQCRKNENVSPGHCFSKQKDNSQDSNSDLHNSSKTVSSTLKNVSLRSKLTSRNVICQCFISKNISPGEEIEDLQNGNYNQPTSCKIQTKPTVASDFRLCRECNNKKSECSQSTKPCNKKEWLPKLKSSLRMSLKKDDKTAINNLPHCLGLPSSNIDEKIPSGKINVEETIQEINDFETQPNFINLTTNQLNVKDNSNSLNFTKISEGSNQCSKCKRDSTLSCDKQSCEREIIDKKSLKDNKLRHIEICKGFGAQLPLSNMHSPRGSIIIIKRNLQKDTSAKDTSTGTSNSVEYLYSSYKCNAENESNQEDKELDSDGWVPLNDVTEIENNQIYLGMDIKNMTVRHIDYVQKFPENLLNCEAINKNKET